VALHQIDPELADAFAKLRLLKDEGHSVTELALEFVVPGAAPPIELIEGGCNILVSNNNVEMYCDSVADFCLWTGIKLQVWAFRYGFSTILPLWGCQLFDCWELSDRLLGSGPIDSDKYWSIDHLRSYVLPDHGFTPSADTFKNLLEALTDFTQTERRMFLKFCTGTTTLPSDGFSGLKPLMKVVKKESTQGCSPDCTLPSVMTCSNYLKLPEYSSKDVLVEKLRMAMYEGQGAFTLS